MPQPDGSPRPVATGCHDIPPSLVAYSAGTVDVMSWPVQAYPTCGLDGANANAPTPVGAPAGSCQVVGNVYGSTGAGGGVIPGVAVGPADAPALPVTVGRDPPSAGEAPLHPASTRDNSATTASHPAGISRVRVHATERAVAIPAMKRLLTYPHQSLAPPSRQAARLGASVAKNARDV